MRLGLGIGLSSVSAGGGAAPTPEEEFLALINGDADAGFFDMTTATAPGSLFTAVDQNGGASFVAPATFLSPGISATDGMLLNATSNRVAGRTQSTAGNVDIVIAFKLDNVATSGRLLNSTTYGIYVSGSSGSMPHAVLVDGVAVTTYGAFYTALNVGAEVTVELRNIPPALSQVFLGSVSNCGRGLIRRAALYLSANRATQRDAAVAAVEAV